MPASAQPVIIPSEARRLEALRALQILETPPETVFDEAVRLAATICGTPIALINLLDEERQWFSARVGLGAGEMPLQDFFSDQVLGRTSLLVVPDTAADPHFRDSPYVTGEPKIRFYAGTPLNTPDGHTIGTMCVADTVPHQFTQEQAGAMEALGRQVATQLELRAKLQLLHGNVDQNERMHRKLRQRTHLFSAFMDHSPTIGFIKDQEGRFLYYNRMFCERFAVSATEWIGKNVFDLFPEEFATAYHQLDMEVLQSGVSQVVEETSPGPAGTTLYWRSHKFAITGDGGEPLLGALCLDISHEREAALRLQASHAQLQDANQQLTQLAVTDGLTGLSNRRAFDQQLAQLLEADRPLSLLLFDVDHFKQLNDTHGHSVGDDVLRSVSALLLKGSRSSDCVARIGGEEFAILLPGAPLDVALTIAERLRRSIATFAWPHGGVTVSAGVTTRSARQSAAELMKAADSALYVAKRTGRNCVQTGTDSGTVLHSTSGLTHAGTLSETQETYAIA